MRVQHPDQGPVHLVGDHGRVGPVGPGVLDRRRQAWETNWIMEFTRAQAPGAFSG